MGTTVRELLEKVGPASSPTSRGERVPRRLLWTLATGVVGLTWSLTTVASYLPQVLHEYASSEIVIGGLLAAEGAVAIAVPLVVGPLSDGTWTRLGRRRPYMLAALPVLVATLVLVALPNRLWVIGVVLGVFFVAYYVYETPYRSLYPDLLPREVEGRAQSVQHVLRGVAIGGALVLGGLLLNVWHGLPFVLSAGIVVATGTATILRVDEPKRAGEQRRDAHGLAPLRIVRQSREVRWFLVANTAWELTFAGMRTFVVLYIVQGLGQPLYVSSAVLATVAAGYLAAALVAGRVGDRIGTGRVIFVTSLVYGLGLAGAVFPSSWHWFYLGYVFVVALAAGTVMTLAWSLLFKLMPDEDRGASSGLATMTKGLGLVLGPVAAGAAIEAARGVLPATHGYAVMWPVLAVPILLAVPVVLRLSRFERQRASA